MATTSSHNKNSSAVKRIMSEARELRNDDSTEYSAGPLEEDIFEWHCTIRGPSDTEFEGGLYHCRIILPSEYPFKAPSIMVLTPNGRFELNKKICISFTSYHEELWQPAWGVRTAIIGIQGFFPLKGEAAVGVGAVEYPLAERKRLAAMSRSWTCPDCGVPNIELLPDPTATSDRSAEPSPSVVIPSSTAETIASQPLLDTTLVSNAVISQSPSFNPTNAAGHAQLASGDATVGDVLKSALALDATLSQIQGDMQASLPAVATSTPSFVTPATTAIPAPRAADPIDRPQADSVGRSRTRSPLWLDASIIFFSFLIAYMAGRRLTNLWEFVSEYV